ncbi:hypothetical protein C5E22_02595 [Pectobacterium parmentieri]|uniref:DUF4153 domain-containing protein n=1 Tax=Pectobacterium parmentieri TaxID=1905730 RepID=UPI000CDDCE89|nr:DUF4153 domain-containing protein [Pectobacterium parmentieri]AYH07314.1 hypothetical protein C5E25_19070 [Pectobacterium parmentieri]AYH16123.1 hypothetical protein C5E23_19005 [Pectobacterium parmentieri]AYH17442.1 hypothetical protein C5E22_02595 [Pectobacterium parmentieri]AYH24833.1 hypothetical protein C5E21_19085 [Pectobacterium parmentieri]MBN3180094.1 DUF4153 domain-containing protein [Pectobacterium parmentieri]
MSASSPSLRSYLVIGLLQGLLFVAALEMKEGIFQTLLIMMAAVGGISLQLLERTLFLKKTWLLVSAMTVLMTAISGWVLYDSGRFLPSASWVLCGILLGYICCTFIRCWPTREGRWPSYDALCKHAWGHIFTVLLAWLVVLVVVLLFVLCGMLFNMLGFPQVNKVFGHYRFYMLLLPVVFSIGIYIGMTKEAVVGLLRGILLSACRFLLPFSALITVVFTLTLPFSGLEPIWNTGRSTVILLCLMGVNLFLINCASQDDNEGRVYPAILRGLVSASVLCLPVLSALAGYSSWLRIEQYGLTPFRFQSLFVVAIAMLYSLAMLWAVIRRSGAWLGHLRTSNPLLAVVTCILMVLLHTPLLSPEAFSARNQIQRLLSGKTPIDKFALWMLSDELGTVGKQQLAWLTEELKQDRILDAAGRQALRDRLEGRSAKVLPAQVEWVGPLEDGVESMLQSNNFGDRCREKACLLFAIDLTGDGHNEVLVFSQLGWGGSGKILARDEKGHWQVAASLFSTLDKERLVALIKDGNVEAVMPRFKTVRIGGEDMEVRYP